MRPSAPPPRKTGMSRAARRAGRVRYAGAGPLVPERCPYEHAKIPAQCRTRNEDFAQQRSAATQTNRHRGCLSRLPSPLAADAPATLPHRGTPPNAFARDSWLAAGFLARGSSPPTTFPEAQAGLQWFVWSSAIRLQLRGQPRNCPPTWTHRIPFERALAGTTADKTDIRLEARQYPPRAAAHHCRPVCLSEQKRFYSITMFAVTYFAGLGYVSLRRLMGTRR